MAPDGALPPIVETSVQQEEETVLWHPAERCRQLFSKPDIEVDDVIELASTDNNHGATFMVNCTEESSVEKFMHALALQCGVGNEDTPDCGTVTVIPIDVSRPRNAPREKDAQETSESQPKTSDKPGLFRRSQSGVKRGRNVAKAASRVLADQVLIRILEGATPSFDFYLLSVTAAILASIGLATNNPVVVVAAMLVSPLMGPILGITFGVFVADFKLVRRGLSLELKGLLIVMLVGLVVGACFSPFTEHFVWPTSEMAGRGDLWNLVIGFIIAVASGAGVALSLTGDNASSLVGVAISASLLPPVANTGMCWFMAIAQRTYKSGDESSVVDYARRGGISLALTVVNIIGIIIGALILFAVKETAPLPNRGFIFEHVTKSLRSTARTTLTPATVVPQGEAVPETAFRSVRVPDRRLARLYGPTYATLAAGRPRASSQMSLTEAIDVMKQYHGSAPATARAAMAPAGGLASFIDEVPQELV